MISRIKTRFSPIPKWLFWSMMAATALIMIIFNDAFGDNEFFGMIGFFYFLLLFFLICRWIFIQTKAVINLKNEKAKTELMQLKSQVNPHFFFNMLNNLYGLVAQDSKKAQELILKLSDLMRYGIYEGQHEEVLLSKEIEYLENYISLHKMRYQKNIDITFDQDIKEDYKVMPLLFIILLENAFKHGVENLREGAYVHLKLTAKGGKITFKIENNFDPTQTSESTGIGLQNLKRRLELVYPKKHRLSLTQTEEVYKAQLTIDRL